MSLLVEIALICLLLTFASELVKLLPISKLAAIRSVGENSRALADLQEQLKQAKAELKIIKTNPKNPGEYTQFIKNLRAENKLKELEAKIQQVRDKGRLATTTLEWISGYALKAVLTITLFIISIRNRYTPVMVFNDRFNFQPLEGLLTFPSGVHNSISVPVWVLSCNVTFRFVSSLLKQRRAR